MSLTKARGFSNHSFSLDTGLKLDQFCLGFQYTPPILVSNLDNVITSNFHVSQHGSITHFVMYGAHHISVHLQERNILRYTTMELRGNR
jgi:hypothetical protein